MQRRVFLKNSSALLGSLALGRSADGAPCPPIVDVEGGSAGAAICLQGNMAEIATALPVGASAFFSGGRNPLTKHAPEISWQNVAVFYDPVRREIQYAGKPQSGVSLDFSHYIFEEDENVWRTTGQSLFPGSGHIWVAAFDYATGDYFFHRQSEDSIRWMRRSTKSWTSTASHPELLGSSNNTINALVFHPNLFGSSDGGLILQSVDDTFAWRKATNTWQKIDSGNYGKNGQGIYLPWSDTALFGGGDYNGTRGSFYRIGPGSGGSVSNDITDLGSNTPIVVGSSGGNNNVGKIVLHPSQPNRLILLESFGSERVWVSSNDGSSWTTTGIKHPFAALSGYEFNGFTANTITSYQVIIGLTSRTNIERETFMIWKPSA